MPVTNVTGTDVITFESPTGANVLRPTKMAVLIAPPGGSVITSIVDATAGTKLSIPNDYLMVGYLEKKDGLGLSPKVTTSPSEAYGEILPIGFYITATEFTASFTAKETKKSVLQEYYAQDLTATTANVTTSEVTFDVASVPAVRYPRLLLVGQHSSGSNAIWVGHWLPKVMITDMGQLQWSDDSDLTYKITYTALVDATVGTARRQFLSGPGMAAAKTTMGF